MTKNMLINFNHLENNNLIPKTEFEKKSFFFIEEWVSNSKKVKVQTSGSTGVPKIFEIEKEKMLNSAKMTCDFLKLENNDSALLCLPIDYISGKMMMVRSFERKLRLWIEEPTLKPLEKLDQIIDFCAMTPLQIENSLDKLHFIKKIIIGGAAVSESLREKINQTLSQAHSFTQVYETYGMSETLSHIALREIYPHPEEYFNLFQSIDISKDERGCLRIYAPKLNSDILQTNDLVEIKPFDSAFPEKKQFLFLGRIDHVINSGGVKISPEPLEALVKKNIPNELVFVGIKDESLGQKLILAIEGQASETIIKKLSSIAYPQKLYQPKEITFIEKIPRTPNGKVNRLELKNILEQ